MPLSSRGGVADAAVSLSSMAELYVHQGKYRQAEPLLRQAREIREQTLGPESPEVAGTLNSLGELYESSGVATRRPSLPSQRRLRSAALPSARRDPLVADSLDGLAGLSGTLGKFKDAEARYQEVLEIRRTALGPGMSRSGGDAEQSRVLSAAWGATASPTSFCRKR